jgi:penicillin-binding protein 1A
MIIAALGTIAFVISTLPAMQSLEVPKRPPTIEIVGLDGRPLVTRGEMSGTDVPIKELPPYLPRAFIAIEDRRFYSHFGIDPIGLARAALANVLRRGVSQGGSTITQQLAKNLWLSPSRNPLRKVKEAILTWQLERTLGKRRILELYLNVVELGAGVYGVGAASRRYFGKAPAELGEVEAAQLAASLPRPATWHPGVARPSYQRYVAAIHRRMARAEFLWKQI